MPSRSSLISVTVTDQANKNIFQRTLARVEILEADVQIAHPLQQRRDAGALLVGIEGIFQFGTAGIERQSPVVKLRRDGSQRLEQIERQLFFTELLHQFDLVLDENQL